MENRFLKYLVACALAATTLFINSGCSDVGFREEQASPDIRQGSEPSDETTSQLDPPEILIHPSSEGAAFDELYVMMVYARGEELSYQWYYNGTAMVGETSSFLRFEPLTIIDIGLYNVMVSNSAGDAASTNAEIALAPPIILQDPIGATVNAGQSYTFTVVAESDDTANYQWRHKGVEIPDATSSTLSLPNVQVADAGSYDVVVTNASGFATSAAVVLGVRQDVLVDVWLYLQNEMGYTQFCNVGEGYGADTDTEILQGMGEHICARLGYGADSYVRYYVGPKKSKRMCVYSPNQDAIVYADPSCTGCRGNIEEVLCSYVATE